MSLWGRKPFVALRVLGTQGHYPAFSIAATSHHYSPSRGLVWTAVVQPPLPDDWELGEVTSLVPEEVRLLSAISLCERHPWDRGKPIVTNRAAVHLDVDRVGLDLTEPTTIGRLTEVANELVEASEEFYDISDVGSEDDALALLEAFDSSDQLLLAGMARYLGGNRLLTAANEPEEAAISLFIASGAALEFIRLHLSADRTEEASFAEVADYLRRTFPHGDDVAEYFELLNEDRVAAIHPSNRFGEFWAPPLMADDVYDLQRALITVYRHILLGEIPVE